MILLSPLPTPNKGTKILIEAAPTNNKVLLELLTTSTLSSNLQDRNPTRTSTRLKESNSTPPSGRLNETNPNPDDRLGKKKGSPVCANANPWPMQSQDRKITNDLTQANSCDSLLNQSRDGHVRLPSVSFPQCLTKMPHRAKLQKNNRHSAQTKMITTHEGAW